MGPLGVGDAVAGERRLGANLDPIHVELFEGNDIEVVALLGVV